MEKILRLIRGLAGTKIPQYAAYASFFTVLAAFPALVLMLALLRYTGMDVHALTASLSAVVPGALVGWLEQVVLGAYRATSGAVISLSALITLWSASRGIYGIMVGLNGVYGVSEGRGYFYTRGISVLYTFLFLLVLLVTLMLYVFGETITNYLFIGTRALGVLRFLLLLVMQTALFTAMFMALPNRKNGFLESLPGAVVSSFGWLIFSDLYSVYVEHFSGYANVFGSVYAVALSMLWLYCCMSILFYGGALNRYLGEMA